MTASPTGLPPVLPQGGIYTLPGFLEHQDFQIKDVASSVLSALLLGAGNAGDYRAQLAAADTRLREQDAGALKGHTLHLFPRQALQAAKASAKARGLFVSASAERFEASLVAAGWAADAPGPVRRSIVLDGKRRTVWSIPAFVMTHAAPFTPKALDAPAALRSLVGLLGLDFTARLAGTSRSSVENWLYGGVPITVARRARLVTAATVAELLTNARTLSPTFWLSNPSKALQRLGDIDPVPMHALEVDDDHDRIVAAAIRSCAAPL